MKIRCPLIILDGLRLSHTFRFRPKARETVRTVKTSFLKKEIRKIMHFKRKGIYESRKVIINKDWLKKQATKFEKLVIILKSCYTYTFTKTLL